LFVLLQQREIFCYFSGEGFEMFIAVLNSENLIPFGGDEDDIVDGLLFCVIFKDEAREGISWLEFRADLYSVFCGFESDRVVGFY
jgi:hypothetical protein